MERTGNEHESNRDRDKKRVSVDQKHEIKYLAELCNCSEEEVERAIREAGDSREKIMNVLKRNRR